jgi:hypothetical protein
MACGPVPAASHVPALPPGVQLPQARSLIPYTSISRPQTVSGHERTNDRSCSSPKDPQSLGSRSVVGQMFSSQSKNYDRVAASPLSNPRSRRIISTQSIRCS